MTEQNLQALLAEAVHTVLETMFFSAPLGPSEPDAGEHALEARIAFHGTPSGTVSVRVSEASARRLAAGFLGEDEDALAERQPGQAICELANMLCGSLVSRLEMERHFDLDSPEFVPSGSRDAALPDVPPPVQQSYALENGTLTVTLHLRTPA